MEGKRLCQIVVRAKVQSLHDIRHGVSRGQHEDGYMVPGLTQPAYNFKSSHSGQHDVENDHIEWIRLADLESFYTIVCQHHRVTFLLQTPLQEVGHFLFILDDQDSHLRTLARSQATAYRAFMKIA